MAELQALAAQAPAEPVASLRAEPVAVVSLEEGQPVAVRAE